MAAPLAPHPETPAHLPTPPFVTLSGIPNFRDLGGWPIASCPNHSVRRNYIFRCGEPTRASEEAVEKIKSLGITHIYDLRSEPEIRNYQIASANAGITEWPGIERIYCPVFPEDSYDPVSIAARHADYQKGTKESMTSAYKNILMQGRKAYTSVVRHILEHPPPSNAFIIHCTAGKDRTGVLCALLLSLCGVDDEAIAEEYSLTELGLGTWSEYLVQAVIKHTGASEENARNMIEAKRESMLGALKMMKEEFGDAAAYFRDQCGFSEDEVKQIRQYLVVEEKPVNGLPKN